MDSKMDRNPQTSTPNPQTSTPKHQGLCNRFKMQQTLGEGTYGKVRLAIDRCTGIKVSLSI